MIAIGCAEAFARLVLEGVAVLSGQTMFRQASGSLSEQFRDNIHLTDDGQATLARLFGSIANPCGDAPAK